MCVGGVLLCLAPLAARAGAPSKLEGEIAALSTRLLQDPLDDAAAQKLAELRAERQKRRREALDALARGLSAYLDGRLAVAAKRLAVAEQWREAADMANATLLRPLDDIIDECKRKTKTATASKPDLCPECGGTKWADCTETRCYGTGRRRCTRCDGRGWRRRGSRSRATCRACGGTGAVACTECRGRGVVPCPKCGGPKHVDDRPRSGIVLGVKETQAIRKVIARARYLSRGGIDLESPQALKPSPKLKR